LTTGSRFDDKYYARFYGDEQTRVTDEKATTKVATFVGAYLDYLDVPVTSVLDLGCGLGFWKDASQNVWKGSEYHGVEISDYLVRTHGWEHGSVVDYDTTQQYDLVVCCGVLQYLSDKDASRAIANIARLSLQAVYIEAQTKEDWQGGRVDPKVSDDAMGKKPAAWYRREFSKHFLAVGGGIFLKKDTDAIVYDLECFR